MTNARTLLTVALGMGMALTPLTSAGAYDRPEVVKMSARTEKTIAKGGPLSLVANCGDGFVEVLWRSTDDWVNSALFVEQSAGELLVATNGEDVPGEPSFVTGQELQDLSANGGAALSVSGWYLGIDYSSLGLGVNVFGWDCVVAVDVLVKRVPGGF